MINYLKPKNNLELFSVLIYIVKFFKIESKKEEKHAHGALFILENTNLSNNTGRSEFSMLFC